MWEGKVSDSKCTAGGDNFLEKRQINKLSLDEGTQRGSECEKLYGRKWTSYDSTVVEGLN